MGNMVLEFASEVYTFTSPSSQKFLSLICSNTICTMEPQYKDILQKAEALNKLNRKLVDSVTLNRIPY